MLTLRYVPELDDIVELMAMSPERRRLRSRAVRNAAVSLVPLCGVLWVGVAERTPGALPVLLICAVLSGSYLLRARALFSRGRLRRHARGVWDRSPTLRRTYEEEIAPEALTMRTDEITQTFAWSGFSGFVESDRQFVLVDHSGEPSVALPKRGLADPSLVPACRRLLTEHLTAARPPGPAALVGD
jgi:hypothetical protein